MPIHNMYRNVQVNHKSEEFIGNKYADKVT